MFCPHCGSKLPDNANFCQICGHELTGNPALANPQPLVEPSSTVTPAAPKRSKLPLIALAVLALVGIGAAVWFFVLGGKLPFGLGAPRFYELDRLMTLPNNQDILNVIEQNEGFDYCTASNFEADDVWIGAPKDNPFGGEASVVFYSDDDLSWLTREDILGGSPMGVEILWEHPTVPGDNYDQQLSNVLQAFGLSGEFHREDGSDCVIAYGSFQTPDGREAFWAVGVGEFNSYSTIICAATGTLQAWEVTSYDELPSRFEFDF